MYSIKYFFLTLFYGIPLVLFIYFRLNYSGFCFAQMRYLSDEDKFRLAFNDLNQVQKFSVKMKDGKMVDREHIPYKSFDEYIKENPGCCKIQSVEGSRSQPPWFLERIFGYYSGEIIVIKFKVRYIDDSGKRRIKEIRIPEWLQNCGERFSWN